MFFNPDFGFEWMRRMKALGYKKGFSNQPGFNDILKRDFIQLEENDFRRIAKELHKDTRKTYLVMFKERKLLDFPIVYENPGFVVYEVFRTDENG